MNILTYKEAGDDGFYMLLAAPQVQLESGEIIHKRLIFVIDRSGSMSGDKIVQAREALKFCVNAMNEGDLFNIIDFDDQITSYKPSPVASGPNTSQMRSPIFETLYAVEARTSTTLC